MTWQAGGPFALLVLSAAALQQVSFDLVQFAREFGLPALAVGLIGYGIFVRQWIVPGWYLAEERQRFKDAEAKSEATIKRANERADRMEAALLKALGATEVISEVVRARAE